MEEKTLAPLVPPSRLTPEELAYHRTVLSNLQAAQTVLNFWSNHLAQTKELTQGDSVGEDGQIVRKVRA